MISTNKKDCPRCGDPFVCRPDNITECQCYGVALSAHQRENIRDQYEGCLCRNCLVAIQEE